VIRRDLRKKALTTKDTPEHQLNPSGAFLGDTSCPWWSMNLARSESMLVIRNSVTPQDVAPSLNKFAVPAHWTMSLTAVEASGEDALEAVTVIT
jgi:hypothetical protein